MDGSETPIAYQSDNQSGASNMNNIDVQRPLYTVPGILHYLQHEWTRFEIERQQWETERAECQVDDIRLLFNTDTYSCNMSCSCLRHVSLFFKANGKDKRV
jgi:hypothetical protein